MNKSKRTKTEKESKEKKRNERKASELREEEGGEANPTGQTEQLHSPVLGLEAVDRVLGALASLHSSHLVVEWRQGAEDLGMHVRVTHVHLDEKVGAGNNLVEKGEGEGRREKGEGNGEEGWSENNHWNCAITTTPPFPSSLYLCRVGDRLKLGKLLASLGLNVAANLSENDQQQQQAQSEQQQPIQHSLNQNKKTKTKKKMANNRKQLQTHRIHDGADLIISRAGLTNTTNHGHCCFCCC